MPAVAGLEALRDAGAEAVVISSATGSHSELTDSALDLGLQQEPMRAHERETIYIPKYVPTAPPQADNAVISRLRRAPRDGALVFLVANAGCSQVEATRRVNSPAE